MKKHTFKRFETEYTVISESAPERGASGHIFITGVNVARYIVDIVTLAIYIPRGGDMQYSTVTVNHICLANLNFEKVIQMWLDGPKFEHIGRELAPTKEGLTSILS